ncbi:MAG: 30S ribosomal protein S17 [Deltaproteobacteria bacterium RIFCSPLOWO2_01_44_7]|nr:MAG: 30S ribosomal protein S17 [Deltaproteobacteria bacterium RIFCSPHIGHO2_01_FULL_43_49]OGQ14962.1 MAG: 30S ribosomal protein S17 [Deltaproteobacteria bacterium RIFCSPHIGHO2_02_FULL_44_53]OGQ29535.1 MAG: 30S ribosomal protein S17 [Deltaproteobacteria bacterium RIFCSPHIGHO2_12_FULL_44_21]OGQ31074.1 MAG: 30S ribosomal protein S17 [Deltaproteobacteria bacterium RIFCSPLOWO2_01_FULL_45_74]OGQ38659.1 MAG: 30S ribosomal protein S17 [Deltaproteobacteria bacterium RIFCSPLOWO2_01_44_7]OGQ42676.1 MAG
MEETTKKIIKTKVGTVVSDAMDKTVVVRVERRVLEPEFKKYVSRRKKFFAHDEKNECSVGDVVRIEETRPLSRHKSWRVVQIVKKGFGKEVALKE